MDANSLLWGGNDLLAILPEATLNRMAPRCSRVTLQKGEVISEADQPIASVLFIESGVASIFKPGPNYSTEIALAGPESFCGTPIVLESESWPYRIIVQADQLTGVQIGASALRQILAQDAELRRVLLRAVQVKLVQVSEGLISNTRQRLSQRLARWLLMYRDRMRSDRLPLTHEYMATMVGVQRSGVTAALHEMEGDGLISARRGLITILSLPALMALAAGGYGVAERHQARLTTVRPVTSPAVRGTGMPGAGTLRIQ
jgi:CRP-like cAMP-binding protein